MGIVVNNETYVLRRAYLELDVVPGCRQLYMEFEVFNSDGVSLRRHAVIKRAPACSLASITALYGHLCADLGVDAQEISEEECY